MDKAARLSIANMGKELESAEQNPAELSTQLRDRTSRVAHLESEASDARKALDEKTNRVAHLEAEASDAQTALDDKTSKVAHLESEASDAQKALDDKTTRIAHLESEASDAQKALDDKTTRIAHLEAEASDTQKALNDKTIRVANLEAAASHAQKALDDKTTRVETLEGELSDAGKAARSERDTRDATIRDLQRQLDAKTTRVETLEGELLGTQKVARSDRNTLDAMIYELRTMIESRDTQVANLNKMLEIERRQVIDKESIITSLNNSGFEAERAARSERDTRDATIQHLRTQATAQAAQISNLEGKLQVERDAIKDRNETIASLNDAKAEAEAAASSERTERDNATGKLQTQVRERDTQISSLNHELDLERRRGIEKDDSIASLNAATAKAEGSNKDQLDKKDAKIQDLEKEVQKAKSDFDQQLVAKDGSISSLEGKYEQVIRDLTAARSQLREKDGSLRQSKESAQKEASEHNEKVTRLEEAITQLNAKVGSMQSSLESLTANRQAALHAMMTFCIGHEISPEEITDDLTRKIVKGLSAPNVKIGVKLPSLTLVKPAISVLPAIRFWVSVLMGRENDVLEQAQILFDTAAQAPIPICWLEISTASLVERLEQWRNRVDLPTFVKLCLVAIQGMTVKRASANKSMKVAAWVQALLKEVPSQCLSFMCDQMATYCAAASLIEIEWLSQFPRSDGQYLDASNSALPPGTTLIADESGLFFLVSDGALSVFTLDDVDDVVWHVQKDGFTVIIHFKDGSFMQNPLQVSATILEGPSLVFITTHMRSKMRASTFPKR